MEGGDLSDRLPPRWLFGFENVVGTLPPGSVRTAKMWQRLGQWRRVVEQYEIEPHVTKVLWDLTWRRDYRFDVFTVQGEDFRDALEDRLNRESVPFSNVFALSPEQLAQRLVYMVDVQYVVHGDPSHHLSYGNRGLLVTDPGALNLW